MDERGGSDRLEIAWAALRLGLLVAFIAAGILALAPSRLGVWLVVAALFAYLFTGLAIAILSYRHTMAPPWPSVPPLPDDDD